MIDKVELILEKTSNKKTLHVGCCDTPFCQQYADTGKLLHMKIKNVSNDLWGIDICEDDIEYLQNKHRIENLVCGDAEKIGQYFSDASFDVIVAGDVLEHLANPGLFLKGALPLLTHDGVIIVSVPNGISFRRGLKALAGKETVHPDHNFWFSRKTICRLLTYCGYNVKEVYGFRTSEKRFISAYLADLFASWFSQFSCEGILAIATPVINNQL